MSVLQSSLVHVHELLLPDKMKCLSYSATNKTVSGKEYVHVKILTNYLSEDERQNLFSDFLVVFYWYSSATWNLQVVWVPILLYANKTPVSLPRKGYSFEKSNFLCHIFQVDFICSHELLQKMFIIQINFSVSFPHTGTMHQELYIGCRKYFITGSLEFKFGRG